VLSFWVLVENSTWLPDLELTMCSDWLKFQKSYSQKPLGRFNYDIVEMFIMWACTSLLFLELIKKTKMGDTLVFNIGHYGEMNKKKFLETTNMIDYWMVA
jgi:hypothetical protein